MQEEYIVRDRKVYGYNKTFGYVPIPLDDIITALKLRDSYPEKMKEHIITTAKAFAGRLNAGYVVQKRDGEWDQDILERSEQFIDIVAQETLGVSEFVEPKEFMYDLNVLKAFGKISDMRLDKLDMYKSYRLTLIFENFSDVEETMEAATTLSGKLKALGVKLSVVVQIESQGAKYQITEVK